MSRIVKDIYQINNDKGKAPQLGIITAPLNIYASPLRRVNNKYKMLIVI